MLRFIDVKIHNDGSVSPCRDYSYKIKSNEMVVILNCYNSAAAVLENRSFNLTYADAEGVLNRSVKALYICPEVHITRDLFRNSGYNIVSKPEKANYVIVPEVERERHLSQSTCHAYNVEHDTLLCYTFIDWRTRTAVTVDQFQVVKNAMPDWFKTHTSSESSYRHTLSVCVLPDIPVYKEMLLYTHYERTYVQELDVPLNTPKINLQTLSIWYACDCKDTLCGMICNSNWQEYPLCTRMILYCQCITLKSDVTSKYMKFVMQALSYFKDSSIEDTVVQPQDWNLWQDFIVAHPATINKNFEQYKRYNSLMRFSNTVIQVKPFYIDTEMRIGEIEQLMSKN